MKKKFKGTQEVCEIRGNKIFVKDSSNSIGQSHVVKNYEDVTFKPVKDIKAESNLELWFDALNTIQKCDKMPSELLQESDRFQELYEDFSQELQETKLDYQKLKTERDELIEFTKELLNFDSYHFKEHWYDYDKIASTAKELLTKMQKS